MRRLIGLAAAVFLMCSSILGAGGVYVTVESNQGQVKATAQEFRYAKSPRELAGGQGASAATAALPTGGRVAGAGRASVRRPSDPVVIVRDLDESSKFFTTAAANGETLTSVVFEFTRARGSETEVYQTVRLTNALVSSVKTVNGDGRPMEEISFTFQKIEYENKDGAAAAPDTWNP